MSLLFTVERGLIVYGLLSTEKKEEYLKDLDILVSEHKKKHGRATRAVKDKD
jgi:hypothetical protein